jgi:restriction endonuclease S subunit
LVKAWFAGKLNEATSSLAWKSVEKEMLLENRSVNLQSEPYLGEKARESSFEIVKLGDVAQIVSGQSPPGESYNESGSGLPFYQGKADFGDIMLDAPRVWTTEVTKRAQRDDVVMSVRAPVGPVNLCTQEICIGRGLAAIRPNETLLRDYLFYFLRNNQDRIRGGDGAVFPSISRHQVAEIEIPLPSLEEQRRIVAEVEGYQKVLDGARRILAVYRAQIPDRREWPTLQLGELIQGKPKNGYSGKPVLYPTNLRVLTLTATTSGKMDISRFKYLDEEIPKDSPCRCRRGDIYLQRGNTKELVGTAALLDVDAPDYIYPDLMIRVRADETKMLTKFLLHTLQSQPVREYLIRNAGGAAGNMPKINQGIVESIPIPLPPLEEQRRIVAELDVEAAQMEAVRSLLPRFEAKIQRILDRVWGAV